MIQVYEILACPLCKKPLSEHLECLTCGEKYAFTNGLYIMINKRISTKTWKWDSSIFIEEKMAKVSEDYKSHNNEETKNAQMLWWDKMERYLPDFHGIVIDVATGLGGLFEKLMKSKSEFLPIATDVDPNVLLWTTSKMRKLHQKEFIGVATDAKYLAFRDNIADYVTSCSGFNNIPQPELAFEEAYRVLKKDGKLIFMHSFFEENSASATLAEQHCIGIFSEKNLTEVLTKIGFSQIKSETVSSAIWAQNPMDLLPVAGDKQYFAIVYAVK